MTGRRNATNFFGIICSFPFDSKGAYSGALVGVITTLWLAIGAQIYPPNKHKAPVSVAQCPSFINRNSTAKYPLSFNGTFYNEFKPHE